MQVNSSQTSLTSIINIYYCQTHVFVLMHFKMQVNSPTTRLSPINSILIQICYLGSTCIQDV